MLQQLSYTPVVLELRILPTLTLEIIQINEEAFKRNHFLNHQEESLPKD